MSRSCFNRWKWSAGPVLFLLTGLVACCWHFGIWSWRDLQIYRAMSHECHPVWRDLYWGRVQAGQDVEEVIAMTKPVSVERFGEFVQLGYQRGFCFTGVTVMAKNGRLVNAGAYSCTWHRIFFDELTPEEMKAFWEAHEAHWRPFREKRAEPEQLLPPDHDER